MIGDGLNDAGALQESETGISLSEDVHSFSPAADAILDAKSFTRLSDFLKFSRFSLKVIIASFILSFIYNLIGLSFAVSGTLSPLIAAILMPVSSISVVLFTTLMTTGFARRLKMLKTDRRTVGLKS
jgi:Cu+-exporting ATPase